MTAILMASIAGCGGGGGGGGSGSTSSGAASTTVAGHIWQQSTTQNNVPTQAPGAPGNTSIPYFQTVISNATVLVTPANNIYTITVQIGSVTGTTLQFGIGSGVASGSTISGTLTNYSSLGVPSSGGVSYTIASGGSAITGLNLDALPLANFNYSQPANISNISGTWSGLLEDGSSQTVAITSSGSISGTSGGCNFSGALTPDPAGENVFIATISFSGAPCVYPNATLTGVAFEYGISTGGEQLVLLGQNSALSIGSAFLGQR